MNNPVKPNHFDDLQLILSTMNVPKNRKGDLRWLARNIAINNGDHPRLDDAKTLLRKLLFFKD
jgi:hypothetical protein